MTNPKRAIVARLDQADRSSVRTHLEQNGFAVTEARDGAEALAFARDELPDLVVADGVLSKLSGFEVCREVKCLAEPKKLPVVLILEEGDSYGRGRARAEGADLILSQPVLEEDLDEILEAKVDAAESAGAILSGGAGTRDRFLKELLRGSSSRNDPITSKISDPLTGLHHREFMTLKVEEEFKKASRYGYPLAALMVDVENYEDVRANLGKPIAQEMLLEVAGIFLCESRDVDCAGRLGDARFMLLLPNTGLDGARLMADRVFQQVCSRTLTANGKDVPIRASVGIAGLPSDDISSVDEFLDRSLRALRTASNMGGNRICAWGDAKVTT